MREALEDRKIGERGQQASREHDLLAADLVRQRAEHHEERRRDQQRRGHRELGAGRVDLQRLLEEQQRIELAAVPHDRLAGGGAKQREQHDLEIRPLSERLGEWRLRQLARGLDLLELRRLLQLHADVHGDQQQHRRQQERNAPAPGIELLGPQRQAAAENDQQREEEAQRRRGLDPARVEAALARRRVLRKCRWPRRHTDRPAPDPEATATR